MKSVHPFHSNDADLGCRHLCLSEPSKRDDIAMAEFLATTKYRGHRVPDSCFPVDHRGMLARVQ